MLKSLKIRLAIWILLPTAILLSLDLAQIYKNSEATANSVQQKLLRASVEIISDQLVFYDGGYEITIPTAALELFRNRYKDRVYYAVRSRDGKLIAGGDELPPYQGTLDLEEEKYYLSNIEDQPVRVVVLAHPLVNSSTGEYAVTQVAQTLRGHNEFRDGLIYSTIRGHALLLGITAFALYVTLHWTLAPLNAFGHLLKERKPGTLEKLDYPIAPTELGPVIDALNDYSERLGQTLSSYEKFVSNTAHHLRTSFAIIGSQIDYGKRNANNPTIQSETLNSIQKTVLDSTKLINQLLMLAAIEQPRKERVADTPVRLAEIITKVIEEMAPLAHQRQIELGVDVFDESVQVAARPHLLHEVFANLVDNSIQHMGRPGTVTISLQRQDDRAHIRILDDGFGVTEELHPRLFERFFRIDLSRPHSSGLGLAIVKEICDSMHASVCSSTPASGSGFQVDILFPLFPTHSGQQ